MDGGAQAIADPAELAQVRKQARAVHLKSLALTVVLTALAVAIPSM